MPKAEEQAKIREIEASGRAAHPDWDTWSRDRKRAYVWAVMHRIPRSKGGIKEQD